MLLRDEKQAVALQYLDASKICNTSIDDDDSSAFGSSAFLFDLRAIAILVPVRVPT